MLHKRSSQSSGAPRVSVIMAANNAKPYIDEAIQSVLAQRGVSFELLIGDDASTDGTWNRIQSYRNDPRVLIFRNRKRQGEGPTRNRLIRAAQGKYFSICDADDCMLSGNLLFFTRQLDQAPEAGVVYGDLLRIDERGRLLNRRVRAVGLDNQWDLLRNVASNGGGLLRASLVRKVGGYREETAFGVDYDLFLRLAEVTRFKPFPGKALYLWRFHSRSMTFTASRSQADTMQRQMRREVIWRRYGYRVPW